MKIREGVGRFAGEGGVRKVSNLPRRDQVVGLRLRNASRDPRWTGGSFDQTERKLVQRDGNIGLGLDAWQMLFARGVECSWWQAMLARKF